VFCDEITQGLSDGTVAPENVFELLKLASHPGYSHTTAEAESDRYEDAGSDNLDDAESVDEDEDESDDKDEAKSNNEIETDSIIKMRLDRKTRTVWCKRPDQITAVYST
jgi:hypothetical protein